MKKLNKHKRNARSRERSGMKASRNATVMKVSAPEIPAECGSGKSDAIGAIAFGICMILGVGGFAFGAIWRIVNG